MTSCTVEQHSSQSDGWILAVACWGAELRNRQLNLCSPRFLEGDKSLERVSSLPPLLPRFRGACDQRQPPCVDSFNETCVWVMTMLSANHIGSAVKGRTFFVGLVSNRVYQEFQDCLVRF